MYVRFDRNENARLMSTHHCVILQNNSVGQCGAFVKFEISLKGL